MPHVARIHGNDPEFSARIYRFPRVYGHHYIPTYFFLISFRVVFLRNDCSLTNRAPLTHWKRTLWMKSGKLAAWHWDVVSTTWNAATRYTWRRMIVASSTWCNFNFFNKKQSMCLINNVTFRLSVCDIYLNIWDLFYMNHPVYYVL